MKKVISLILCLLLSVMVIGCTPSSNGPTDSEGNTVTDQTKILDIVMWNSGYGTKWVEKLADEYKKSHPGIAINIDAKSGQSGTSAFYNTITTGVNANNADLYFAYGPKYLDYVTGQYASNPLLESLNEVVEYTVPGESKTIGQKIGDKFLDVLVYDNETADKTDDQYYALSFSNGASGIVYNAKLFGEYNLSVPRTTDEMINLVVEIQDNTPYKGTRDGKVVFNQPATPFIHYPGYWMDAAQTWWAQYEGPQGMKDFWNFANVSDIKNPLQAEYQTVGMKLALDAMYNVIALPGATHATSNTESDYMTIQSNFIEEEVALMYPCGGFLETELEKLDGFDLSVMNNFKMMRTPVLSAIANKLDAGHQTDNHLCQLIDFVDGVAEKPDWASDDEAEIVRAARFADSGQATSSTIAVPSYALGKELAKDFLKFMFSDTGMKLFAETQRTFLSFSFDDATIVNSIDKSSWTSFAKSVFELSQNNDYFTPNDYKHPLRYKAGLIEWLDVNGAGTAEYWFTNPSETQRKTVDQYLDHAWTRLMAQWQVYLQGAGLAN